VANWRDRWPDYAKRCYQRLEVGEREYGDRSFADRPDVLLQQIREELEDVAAWSFILHCRLDELERVFGEKMGKEVEEP
jgi:hypothetical protein